MARGRPTRDELLAMKRDIAERIIFLIDNDPELRSASRENRIFGDLLSAGLKWLKPELRLWATDVVWRES